MFKSDSIRPIALGIAKKDNKILVGIGYDKVKNGNFCVTYEDEYCLPIKLCY